MERFNVFISVRIYIKKYKISKVGLFKKKITETKNIISHSYFYRPLLRKGLDFWRKSDETSGISLTDALYYSILRYTTI